MVTGQETIVCWVPVPYLTMVITSIAFFFSTYLLTTHKQVVSKHSAAHHEGGMVSDLEKDFCWIPVP